MEPLLILQTTDNEAKRANADAGLLGLPSHATPVADSYSNN
jgi:hypothetical protein